MFIREFYLFFSKPINGIKLYDLRETTTLL